MASGRSIEPAPEHGYAGHGPRVGIASERTEWRAVACSLALVLSAFGAGWLYSVRTAGVELGWPVAAACAIALAWWMRALIGWSRGDAAPMAARALDDFRDRHFWSRPARWSYAALLVCDALFMLDVNPGMPLPFFLLAALSALFAVEVGVLTAVLGAALLF